MQLKIQPRQIPQAANGPGHCAGNRRFIQLQFPADLANIFMLKIIQSHDLLLPLGKLGFNGPVQKLAVLFLLPLIPPALWGKAVVSKIFKAAHRNAVSCHWHTSPFKIFC